MRKSAFDQTVGRNAAAAGHRSAFVSFVDVLMTLCANPVRVIQNQHSYPQEYRSLRSSRFDCRIDRLWGDHLRRDNACSESR